MMVGKPSPNYLSINYMSDNYMRGASTTSIPALYGQYDNVLLTEAELAALQAELPDRWQHYIERLSEYMASTGRRYKNHLATIRRWAADDAKKNTRAAQPRDYSVEKGETV